MNCIGIDLGKVHLQVCELGDHGELWEKRIRPDRERIVEVFSCRPRGLFSSPTSAIESYRESRRAN